jgi:hypothetical protein
MPLPPFYFPFYSRSIISEKEKKELLENRSRELLLENLKKEDKREESLRKLLKYTEHINRKFNINLLEDPVDFPCRNNNKENINGGNSETVYTDNVSLQIPDLITDLTWKSVMDEKID